MNPTNRTFATISIMAIFLPTVGKQTVLDIMVMMGYFTVDMAKEKHLAQLIRLATLLVVASTTFHKNFSSRKITIIFRLSTMCIMLFMLVIVEDCRLN